MGAQALPAHLREVSISLLGRGASEAVQKQEEMPILRYHLALALYGEGKKQEAIQEAERALSQKQSFKEKEEAIVTLQKWQSEK